jgi:hypothetical protein
VVHETIYPVFIAGLRASQSDWLNGAVTSICIKRFKEEDAYALVTNTVGRVPLAHCRTAAVGICGCRHIGNEHEIGGSLRRPVKASELGILELKNDVVRGCAWPLSAVCRVCPARIRIVDEDESSVLNVAEFSVLELAQRSVVSVGRVALDGMLFGTTLCSSLELVEIDVI